MKLKNALDDLKLIFNSYSQLWETWRIYKFNNLTEEDIYLVEVYRLKKFIANFDDLLMFYSRPKFIESITEKLNLGLREFQKWETKHLNFIGAE